MSPGSHDREISDQGPGASKDRLAERFALKTRHEPGRETGRVNALDQQQPTVSAKINDQVDQLDLVQDPTRRRDLDRIRTGNPQRSASKRTENGVQGQRPCGSSEAPSEEEGRGDQLNRAGTP